MSSTPNTPGEETPYVETTSSALPRWVMLLFVIAFVLVAYLLYAGPGETTTRTINLITTTGNNTIDSSGSGVPLLLSAFSS